MKALAIAATGMNAQQLNLEVISNNIANINTTGFKRARAEFSDLLYQAERTQGVPNSANQAIVPEGAHIGLGVQTTAVRNLHLQGSLNTTGNPLDMALVGRGWFQISTPDGETVYTRAGAFNLNAEGTMVTVDGYELSDNINIPQDATEVIINRSGQIAYRQTGVLEPQIAGQLSLANFVNEAGLEPMGDNLFRATVASGAATVGTPDEAGFAYIQQSYLEASNVDPVKEITDLISAQRAYEMNSKIIQAADEMASVVSRNLR